MTEYVYCAVDMNGDVHWVQGSSKKTRYFKTPKYVKNAVYYHNMYSSDSERWKVQKFKLVPVDD